MIRHRGSFRWRRTSYEKRDCAVTCRGPVERRFGLEKIVAITSGLGSISIAGGMSRGPYYYRMSKAALDMGMRALGADQPKAAKGINNYDGTIMPW
jgi:hypothetical protein